jgi:shikimate kinase
MKIYLIGFMGCGKTTIGKRLASRLGFSFVDTDELFATEHGCSVKDYFDLHSEEEFRKEEQKILYQTQSMDDTVIAAGGGMPCYQDNMQWILANGIVVYIKMSAAALHSRLCNSKNQRPLLSSPSDQDLKITIEKLLSQRENIYNTAHITVSGLNFDMENLVEKMGKDVVTL